MLTLKALTSDLLSLGLQVTIVARAWRMSASAARLLSSTGNAETETTARPRAKIALVKCILAIEQVIYGLDESARRVGKWLC